MNVDDVPIAQAPAVRHLARKILGDMPPYVADPDDYDWLLPDGQRIVKGVYEGGVLRGFCAVDTIEQFLDLKHVPESPQSTCYVSALALEPVLRGRGLGTVVLREAIRAACDRRWKYASGHFREGASNRAARAVLRDLVRVAPVQNHLGSWETYYYLLARIL